MDKKVSLFFLIGILTMIFSATSFSEEKIVDIYAGESVNLDSFLVDNEGLFVNSSAKWTSSNEDVVTVNRNGVITGVRSGTAYVYVSMGSGTDTVSTVVKVRVNSMIKKFIIPVKSTIVSVGEPYKIDYEIIPADKNKSVINDTVYWRINSKILGEVDEDGIVEGFREGTVVVTGYTEDGNFSDSIKIEFVKLKNRISIDDGTEKIKFKVGETHQFIAKNGDVDVTESVDWESRDREVLLIDEDGFAEAVNPGEILVKASTKARDNYDYVYVEVESMIEELRFLETNYTLSKVGEKFDVDYYIVPSVAGEDPIIDEVVWTSSDSSIARVNSHGEVTAVGPGVVRITGKTKDGNFEDSCSVKVEGKVELEKKVFVEDFSIENFPDDAMTGEEILVDVKYYPRHATETKFTYTVEKGGNSQFKNIDGNVYFIPGVDGSNKITVRSQSGIEKIASVNVKSPIKDIEVFKDNFRKKSSSYVFYLGEEISLEYEFKLKKGYSYSEIYMDDVKWTTSDSEVASVKKDDEEYILKAEGVGSSNITLISLDGNNTDQFRVIVESPLKSVNIKKDISIPVDVKKEIEVENFFKNIDDLEIDEEKFVENYKYKLGKSYLNKEYVEKEIKFENEFIIELHKSIIENPNFSKDISLEIKDHNERLDKLKTILKSEKNGYCFLPDSIGLRNRLGDKIKIADIDGNEIEGFEEGKVEVTVEVPGTNLSDKEDIFFTRAEKELLVINEEGNLISYSDELSDKDKSIITDDSQLKSEIYLAMLINERFKGKSKKDIPSNEYINSILVAEDREIVPDSMKKSYKNDLTREQLGEMAVKLYEYLSNSKVKSIDYSVFTDTSNMELTKAYNMGFVDSIEKNKFFPKTQAESADIIKAITKVINVSKLSGDAYKNKLTSNLDSVIKEIMNKDDEEFTIENAIWYFYKLLKD